MATLSSNRYALAIVDQTKEVVEHSIYTIALTSINFTAQEGKLLAYKTAVEGLIIGNVAIETIFAGIDTEDPLPVPADGNAQVEMDWVIKYQDTVTFKSYLYRIATPDMGTVAMRKPNSNRADTSHAAWVAFIAAFNAVATSVDRNAAVFVDAVLLSRKDRLTPKSFAAVK